MTDTVLLKLPPETVVAHIYTPHRFAESKYGYYGLSMDKDLLQYIQELQPFFIQPNVARMKKVFIKTTRRVEIDTNNLATMLQAIQIADATNLDRDVWLARQNLQVEVGMFDYINPITGKKGLGLKLEAITVMF